MAIAVAPRAIYLNCAFKPGFWSGDTAPTAYYDAVNFTKLEITSQKASSDILLSNTEGTVGEALASVSKPTDNAKITMDANYMSPAILALLIGADTSDLSQTTAAITAEAITPVQGMWIPLANKYLAAHGTGTEIVAKTAADATVASSHYEIDLINGLFKALDATGATVTKLDYHTATRAGEIYKAGKSKSAYVKLVGTGTEKVSQKRCRLVIHKASLTASSVFDPVGGGYLSGTLAGDLLTPVTETSPWEYIYTDLAA